MDGAGPDAAARDSGITAAWLAAMLGISVTRFMRTDVD